jgi:ankyrin repeat protein
MVSSHRLVRNVCLVALLSAADLGAAGGGQSGELIAAVRSGNHDAVQVLLHQAAVNAREADGTTALHWAARAGDVECVRLLLQAGADAKAANRYGVTPLALAALNGDAVTTGILLKAGADANATASEGTTVLMTAARAGATAVAKALLDHGANANAREHRLGETALMWAAAENHPEAIAMLLAHGADADARSDTTKFPRQVFGDGIVALFGRLPRGGWTPLMYAARQGALIAAATLADGGADFDAVDPDGTTAMALAIDNAHFDVARMLLEKGADPNVADTTGTAALYAAVEIHRLGEAPGRPAPKPTGTVDGADLVKALLDYGADPNARLNAPVLYRHHSAGDGTLGEGATPFLRAAKNADLPLMRLLVEHGANPLLMTKNQTTSVMFAAGTAGGGLGATIRVTVRERIEAIALCLDRGVDINAVNSNGQSALHIAVQSSDDIVSFLAQHGARLDLKDKQGRTPLDVALGAGGRGGPSVVRESTVALLRRLANGTEGDGGR